MNVPTGWYHASGDPVGTVRRWNGDEWIGFPVPDPNLETNVHPRFEPVHGQVQLKPFAIAVEISLIAVIAVYVMRLYVTIQERSYQVAVHGDVLLEVDTKRNNLDGLILTQTFLWIGALLLLFTFGGLWFWRATANMRLWHQPMVLKRGLRNYTPLNLMLELQTHSPRQGHEGAMNPALAWGWWALFAGAGAVERAIERSSHGDSETAASLLALRIGFISLTMISFLLAIVLVEQITKHQDARMVPTAAQREQLHKERALEASLATDPYRTNADGGNALYQLPRS